MPKAEFGSYKMDLVEGFRISIGLTPGQGFGGNFYVYVKDRIGAPERPKEFLKFPSDNQNPKGNLVINGDGINYTFRDIELIAAVVGADRSARYRIFEFRYPPEMTDRTAAPIDLSNSRDRGLEPGKMGEDFKYSIPGEGSAEPLLGISSLVSANETQIVRFSALRNKNNSFLKKAVSVNDAAPGGGALPEFNVDCGKLKVNAKPANLDRLFVEESYGTCVDWITPPLSDYLRRDLSSSWLSRVRVDSEETRGLLRASENQNTNHDVGSVQSIETATFCLRQGTILAPEIA